MSNQEITNALDEMVICCGVKEDIAFDDLIALLQKKDTQGCVQEIATRLGLPIRINLSYVPKDFKPGNTNRFCSSELAKTDWTGRGMEGITAQVYIPQNLPMFGTSALQDYPIEVRVSENCHEHPYTFVAIMAHELSHVLLASLRSPHKDSELHTDLVPILLGFRDAVRRGRRKTEMRTSGNTTTTYTTTYGYLTDWRFEFACDYVTGLLSRHSHNKKCLVNLVEQVQYKIRNAIQDLATFRDYIRYLDIHPPERMKKEHAERVVQLHGRDYSIEWECQIRAVKKNMEIAEAFARGLNHYRTTVVEKLKTQIGVLEKASEELDNIIELITNDVKILRQYVGLVYRLRWTLRKCRVRTAHQ